MPRLAGSDVWLNHRANGFRLHDALRQTRPDAVTVRLNHLRQGDGGQEPDTTATSTGEPVQLIFEQIRAGGDRNFGYLAGDRDARRGILIDPSYSPDAFVDRARAQGLDITHVVNTHGHPDHVNGNARARELTGALVAAHPLLQPDVPLEDRAELTVGALRFLCLHVPGHSPDHVVLYEPTHQFLITGDLLFVGKVGGTGSDADAENEWHSLQRVIGEVPDSATVWPGHDYGVRPSSTIALEKQSNPFLRCPDLAAFLQMKAEWLTFKARLGLK